MKPDVNHNCKASKVYHIRHVETELDHLKILWSTERKVQNNNSWSYNDELTIESMLQNHIRSIIFDIV